LGRFPLNLYQQNQITINKTSLLKVIWRSMKIHLNQKNY
jgi:hypothetical protein